MKCFKYQTVHVCVDTFGYAQTIDDLCSFNCNLQAIANASLKIKLWPQWDSNP